MATVSFTSQLKTHAWTPLQGALRVMVARSISRTKSSDFPALKKTLDRGMLHTSASNHLGTDICITLLSVVLPPNFLFEFSHF
jgi:hypothetical protein